MDRHRKWLAAMTALTATTWVVSSALSGPPEGAPTVTLGIPVFDESANVLTPAPQAARSPKSSVVKKVPPKSKSTIRQTQATDGDPAIAQELFDEPPPPSRNLRSSEPTPAARPMPEAADNEPHPHLAEHPVIEMRRSPSELSGAGAFAPPYLPSNQSPDALPWTAAYEDRAARAPVDESIDMVGGDLSELPRRYSPWWVAEVPLPIRASQDTLPVDVDSLVIGALQYAPQVMGIRTQPDINNSIMAAENAAFDWTAFVNSKWDDLNDPVGNTLTTGNNSNRFIDQVATVQAGVRRRNQYGGELEVSQKWGWQDNNSRFFVPAPQGTTRLQLNYTQPLLNGAGVAYNQSRIVLAQVELNRSFDVVQEEIQNHLVKVTEAYWDLYRSRVVYLQRKRVYDSAIHILDTLGGREEIDALQRQVNRAKAAVASRRSEIVRAQASIRNAESRLRLLVNDPRFLDLSKTELVPIEAPRPDHVQLSLSGSLQQALQNRPDISQAVHDLRAAGVRLGVAQNELLPKLDLVLNSYVAGLSGDHDILQSWGNQFADGRPGYTVGGQFEMPLGNRAAQARQDRRQWELTKAVYDFRTVVETGLTDVELAVRESETSYREMLAKFQSLIAAETEASYLEDRWKVLPGADRGTTLLLEDLLDAQQRLADTEGEFVQSQVSYSIALIRTRRAMGTLLICQNPTQSETRTETIIREDAAPAPTPADVEEPPLISISKSKTTGPKTKEVPSEKPQADLKKPQNRTSWFRW
jgi:outer membrane protein TolC